jgi:DNA-binding SARP family transcriptional activator/TolB-like protein/Tfp pilus assembly protein PilF
MQRITPLCLRLFGEFALTVNSEPPVELPISSRKGRALIAYLALHPDHRASREHLANLLWGNRHDVQARQDLRQCLASLRRDLSAVDLLVVSANSVGLNIDDLAVDALELAALATTSEPDLARAATFCRGELLSGVSMEEPFNEWLSLARHRFDAIASNVLEACAKHAHARGNGRQAIDAAERLIAIDPLREDWQRLVIEIYAHYRSREAALSHAGRVTALFKRELGAEAEPATTALVNEIRRGGIMAATSGLCGKVPETVEVNEGLSTDIDIVPSDPTPAVGTTHSKLPRSPTFLARLSRCIERSSWPSVGVASFLIIALSMISSLWLLSDGQVGKKTATSAQGSYVSSPFRGAPSDGLSKVGSSVIVLPFTTDGDHNGNNKSIAHAITDDLATALTQNSEIRVISRRVITDDMGSADVAELRTRFGIRYIVDGGVRSEESRLRVNVALVDATNGLQVWSDQFAQNNGQIVEGEIVARLARELQFGMTLAQSRLKVEDNAGESAIEQLIFKGQADLLRDSGRESTEEELALFDQALRREPDSPAAQLGVAMALIRATLNSLADDPQQNLDRAEEMVNKVLQREPTSYRAEYWKGLLHKARGELGGGHAEFQSALQALNRTLELNPSATYVHAQVGAVLVKLGRPSEGLDEIQDAIRLNPKDPSIGFFYVFAGEAELELRRDLEAIEWLTRAIARMPRNPTAYKLLSASYALTGDRVNMEKSLAQFREFSANTAYQRLINSHTTDAVYRAATSRSRISEGLRLALTP